VDSFLAAIPANTAHVTAKARTRQREAKIELRIAAAQHTAQRLIAARTGKSTGEAGLERIK
jgi:hypothetical protein